MTDQERPTIEGLATAAGVGPAPLGPGLTVAELNAFRERCLAVAEQHIQDAELLMSNGRASAAYVLASFGIEEIGKAELQLLKVGLDPELRAEHVESAEEGETDHRHKLTWAFFSARSTGGLPKVSDVQQAKRLADAVYRTRISALYSAKEGNQASSLTPEEAQPLVTAARARLEMAKATSIREPSREDQEAIDWLMRSLQDKVFFRFAQGTPAPSDDNVGWVHALRSSWGTYVKSNAQYLQAELNRPRPTGREANEPKWRITLKVDSEWHRFRQRILDKSNERDLPFFLSCDRRNERQLTVQLRLLRSVPVPGLWPVGHDMARLFLLALNIGSMGLFWWRISNHKRRFYEEIADLEGGGTLGMERKDEGDIEWGKPRTLSDEDLTRVAMCFGYLMRQHTPGALLPFYTYELGTACWAMHDVHASLAPPAFANYLAAYRTALKVFKGLDPPSVVSELTNFFGNLSGDFEDLDALAQHARDCEGGKVRTDIGIKFASYMKVAADGVICRGAIDALSAWALENPTDSAPPTESPPTGTTSS